MSVSYILNQLHNFANYDYTDKSEYSENYRTTAKKLKSVLSYIDQNIDRKLQLEELAHIACMSVTYFSTIFKKFNGISPWEYIAIKRVEKAIHLLKTSNMNKLEIAEACGFQALQISIKCFQKSRAKRRLTMYNKLYFLTNSLLLF